MNENRSGLGFDSHSFSTGGTLRLGGVEFPGIPSLKGHSDGDALLHAVIDALLGAAGLGDIGQMFPDTSPEWKGADSGKMLAAAVKRVRDAGFAPINVDVVVVAEKPRLSEAREKIITAVSKLIGVWPDAVSIKGKTPEGLNLFSDPAGGVAVWATASIEKRK
jgi:2-C-methyl-D-erythritol 2,4-cyclodiphosphate synthase